MKIIVVLALLTVSDAHANGFPDGSSMGTPEMAKCSAAALKVDMKTWKKWYAALEKRYSLIYSDKSKKELESYTIERAMDKKKALNRDGIDSKRAFKNYFDKNCAGEI